MDHYRRLVITVMLSIFALSLLLGLPFNSLAQEDFEVYLPVIFSNGSGDSPPDIPDILDDVPVRPPSDFAELIELNVLDGIWTREEGIIQILQLLLDEKAPADIPGLDEVVFWEATGVEQMAVEYLADNPDPTAATEIERLLNLIFPTQAKLDFYSEPISGTAQISGTGAIQSQPLQSAQQDCVALWKQGLPDDVNLTGPCLFYAEQEVLGKTMRVYHPVDGQDDPDLQLFFAAALQAMVESTTFYAEYGDMPDATLIFSPAFDIKVPTAKAATGSYMTFAYTQAYPYCPIVVYTPALGYSIDKFKQIIAHEMFHCFQRQNLVGPGSYDWWIEGSANYFSNELYPEADLEQELFLDDFNKQSAKYSILNMDYENFIFFQYLGNRLGNQNLIEFLEGLSSRGSIFDQAEYLASFFDDIENLFHGFGLDYFDGNIMDSSGVAIASDGLPLHFTSDNSYKFKQVNDSADLTARAFLLARYPFEYQQRKRFTQDSYEIGTALHSTKPMLAQALNPALYWTDLPQVIETGCDNDDRYFLLLTATDINKQTIIHFQNKVTAVEERERCTCYFEADLGGAVVGAYRGPAFYDLTNPNPLITGLYNQWFSQTALPNDYTPGQTGTVTAQGFTLVDTAAGLSVAAQASDEVIVTIDESTDDLIRGRMHGTLTDVSVDGGGQVSLFAEFKAAKTLSELANQCDLEWE